jgi:ABC-type Fe3+/spermidine/putrescine transport system ATPase subunit
MAGKEDRYPAKLSGGEKQRVALARSLVLQPEVLLLDEPLSALDPNLRKQVRGELRALQRESGTTFVMVTHDKEEALAMADQVAVMHDGRLEQVGTPQEIYLRPKTRFVAGFLGAVNWIDGVGVRPEAIQIHLSPNGHTRAARIEAAVFLGNVQHVTARFANGESVVAETARRDADFTPGRDVHLSWNPQDELRLP